MSLLFLFAVVIVNMLTLLILQSVLWASLMMFIVQNLRLKRRPEWVYIHPLSTLMPISSKLLLHFLKPWTGSYNWGMLLVQWQYCALSWQPIYTVGCLHCCCPLAHNFINFYRIWSCESAISFFITFAGYSTHFQVGCYNPNVLYTLLDLISYVYF